MAASKGKREQLPEQIALAAFDKKIGDADMTDAQKKQRVELVNALRSAKFKKSASKHGSTALSAIEKLTQCANTKRYAYTTQQVEQLKKAFKDALEGCFGAFDGKLATKAKLAL